LADNISELGAKLHYFWNGRAWWASWEPLPEDKEKGSHEGKIEYKDEGGAGQVGFLKEMQKIFG
jgi:hypothetical protein